MEVKPATPPIAAMAAAMAPNSGTTALVSLRKTRAEFDRSVFDADPDADPFDAVTVTVVPYISALAAVGSSYC
jgi:hypothetical protein